MQPEAMQAEHTDRPRIAVLGASGFIGSAIAKESESQGIQVTLLQAPRLSARPPNSSSEAPEIVPEAVVLALAAELQGHDIVINAAGISDAGSHATPELYGANALLPIALARAARRAGLQRLVHISSAAVQGRNELDETPRVAPFSPYSHSKALGEKWLQRIEGIEVAILRPTSVHGPERPITQKVAKLAASPVSSIAGSPRPSPQTRVDTVARSALYLAMHPAPPRITLTPDEGITTDSLLRTLGNREPKRVPVGIAKNIVRTLNLLGTANARIGAYARRLEMLWFGQRRTSSWLDNRGLVPPNTGWGRLGADVAAVTKRPSVFFGVTSGASARGFFRGQFRFLESRGWRVLFSSNDDHSPQQFADEEGVTYIPIRATRRPDPLRDAVTLVSLVWRLIKLRPDVAVWGSPKIGLLGSIAARLTFTPSVYVIHGLRLETTSGLLRKLLKQTERVAATCANSVVVVGHELRDRVVELGIARDDKVTVLVNGSANGVPPPDDQRPEAAMDAVVGYVGRITPDKGLRDLITAWHIVLASCPNARLVIAGAVEEDRASQELAHDLASLPNTDLLGHVENLDELYPRLQCLVLPSYREGLPNVVLEAARFGVPTVASDATGASESIVHGVTGLTFPVRNAHRLAHSLLTLLQSKERAYEMGRRARRHVETTYNQHDLWSAWHAHLLRCTHGATRYRATRDALDGLQS